MVGLPGKGLVKSGCFPPDYRIKNKEQLAEKDKIKYQKNKDIINEKKKKYRKNNKEKIKEKDKIKYQKNKEQILQRNKEKIKCNICGCESTRNHLKRHQRTIKCQSYLTNS